jgi:hypothetical protein
MENWCPAPHSMASKAQPKTPLSQLRPRQPSIFICQIAGSIALRSSVIPPSNRVGQS